MRFTITEQWLRRRLERADDGNAAAGGTSREELKGDAQRRTVTPETLAHTPTQIGKVVRYIREQRGWSRDDLARMADVEVGEITALETQEDYSLSPRAAVYLPAALGLSRKRFQEQLGLRRPRAKLGVTQAEMRYAAHSKVGVMSSDEEFETIRALVAALSERDP
jgi:transcriptional regulator with XRE-family HTH domain